jgi:hypothetical protein
MGNAEVLADESLFNFPEIFNPARGRPIEAVHIFINDGDKTPLELFVPFDMLLARRF